MVFARQFRERERERTECAFVFTFQLGLAATTTDHHATHTQQCQRARGGNRLSDDAELFEAVLRGIRKDVEVDRVRRECNDRRAQGRTETADAMRRTLL